MSDGDQTYEARRRRGTVVIWQLAVLTAIEYAIAAAGVVFAMALLTIIAVAKAALIVRHFMHLGQLRTAGH